jgi:hypothetical protein
MTDDEKLKELLERQRNKERMEKMRADQAEKTKRGAFGYGKGTKQGIYVVQNPSKYIGNKNPVFKSTWEQNVFYMFDNNPYVKKWGYECQALPYFNPVKNKQTLYYPDIFVHLVDKNGKHKQILIEIKPDKFTRPPVLPRTRTKKAMVRHKNAQMAYAVNVSKWEAASNWCKKHHVQWMLVTEKNCSAFTGGR